jgi:hypothetical protein
MVYPQGPIPRVGPKDAHQAFSTAVQPRYVMVNIRDARRLVKRRETADSFFGSETSVIVTTTIFDGMIHLLSWKDELEIIEDFIPSYHIPTYYFTYDADSETVLEENLNECMKGTLWMDHQLRDTPTQVIPILKGATPHERQTCYRMYDQLEAECAAFYVAQYFSGGRGILINELVEDVTTIAEEWDGDLLLIGLLSSNYLPRMPTAVVASAGNRGWRKAVKPKEHDSKEMRHRYWLFAEEIATAIPGASRDDLNQAAQSSEGEE